MEANPDANCGLLGQIRIRHGKAAQKATTERENRATTFSSAVPAKQKPPTSFDRPSIDISTLHTNRNHVLL